MKNMVILQKDDDGNIVCAQISEGGKAFVEEGEEGDEQYWEAGGTILLDELNEILDKEI